MYLGRTKVVQVFQLAAALLNLTIYANLGLLNQGSRKPYQEVSDQEQVVYFTAMGSEPLGDTHRS